MKSATRLISIVLCLAVAVPTVGCQQKPDEKDKQKVEEKEKKGLDIQIEAGNTKVKVQGSRNPDDKGDRPKVEVEHHE